MHALETENVLDLVARIRRASPQVPLVIGGHTAAAYPAPFVNAAIDAIVLDDGERAVPRLVDALDRGRPWSSVPGVAIRGADGAWVRTPADDDVFELDDVPSPARRHVDRWRRQYACLAHRPTWLIETARGCPYRCSFCSIWQLHARSVRERSIGSVCDDFERVGDDVFVADDLFWYHPSRSLELAHALRKRGIRKSWVLVQSRVDTVARHPELLEAWRPIAREFDIFFGLEAASDDGLKGLVKDATVGQTEEAIEIARGARLRRHREFRDRPGLAGTGLRAVVGLRGSERPAPGGVHHPDAAAGHGVLRRDAPPRSARGSGRTSTCTTCSGSPRSAPQRFFELYCETWRRSVLNLGGRKSVWQWLRQVEPRNAMFLMKALWRTQRMMDPRHYVAEYDLGSPSESVAGALPSVELLTQENTI